MAIATNAFTTYESVGNREDLNDVITNISPVDTFFTSNSKSGTAKARITEWQTDALAAAAENAQIEGDDSAAATAVTPTVRVANYTQILRKIFQITETEETITKAGRKSEIAYQTQKNLKELAKDIEYALLINSASAAGASGTARKMMGVNGWLTTNVTTGTATGSEALTETMYNDNLQLIWAEGGVPQHSLCGAFQKRVISGWTTNTKNTEADEKKLTASVDVYESDFGKMKIRLHRQINTTIPGTIINLGDMGLWEKAWLRNTKKINLAKTGDSDKFMVIGELTLKSLQEKGAGKITQLTTS